MVQHQRGEQPEQISDGKPKRRQGEPIVAGREQADRITEKADAQQDGASQVNPAAHAGQEG